MNDAPKPSIGWKRRPSSSTITGPVPAPEKASPGWASIRRAVSVSHTLTSFPGVGTGDDVS